MDKSIRPIIKGDLNKLVSYESKLKLSAYRDMFMQVAYLAGRLYQCKTMMTIQNVRLVHAMIVFVKNTSKIKTKYHKWLKCKRKF